MSASWTLFPEQAPPVHAGQCHSAGLHNSADIGRVSNNASSPPSGGSEPSSEPRPDSDVGHPAAVAYFLLWRRHSFLTTFGGSDVLADAFSFTPPPRVGGLAAT